MTGLLNLFGLGLPNSPFYHIENGKIVRGIAPVGQPQPVDVWGNFVYQLPQLVPDLPPYVFPFPFPLPNIPPPTPQGDGQPSTSWCNKLSSRWLFAIPAVAAGLAGLLELKK